jgi:ATP-dependent Lon protease
MRNLERELAAVCRKVAVEAVKNDNNARVKVSVSSLSKYLGPRRFRYGLAETKPHVGVATSLVWTELGGELVSVEVTIVPGRGKLTVTGQLGEVMRESAHAALSFVRSRTAALGLDPNFYQKSEIHIHLPEGAVPKDGPSAGITMATALVSALCKVPVRTTWP